ncbi:hypothetical protein K435DRAFT_796872 [Dendrothele bispora CBS 962.96]|uniref:Uncharacterized protein n=1 Tax=Dendrothele bispora (strain CBS 962.96) TaxID=1314807 RepID=A0A4S8M495_DENBC|nr:hypothetical protein K435DRAFT_796872 [Dendrothele bispora CBS 962.96]
MNEYSTAGLDENIEGKLNKAVQGVGKRNLDWCIEYGTLGNLENDDSSTRETTAHMSVSSVLDWFRLLEFDLDLQLHTSRQDKGYIDIIAQITTRERFLWIFEEAAISKKGERSLVARSTKGFLELGTNGLLTKGTIEPTVLAKVQQE